MENFSRSWLGEGQHGVSWTSWTKQKLPFTVGLAAVLCLIQPMELVNVFGRRKERKDENRSNGKETAETFWLRRESYNSLSLQGQARICGTSGVFCHYNILLVWIDSVSLVAQTVKNLPAMQETQVQSLGQKDPLEEGMATHSSILAWRIPWTEEPGGLQSPRGHKESDTTEQLTHTHKVQG